VRAPPREVIGMRAILTYHSIDESGSPVSCPLAVFDRHVRWLSSGRVQVTSIEELVALPASADAVAVTFDDAFVNFGDLAAPRLLAHGIPSTLFVVSDHVGGTNAWRGRVARGIPHLPLLDWATLGRLREQGVSLGAHSRTHPDLTGLASDRLEDEVRGSAEMIARETGVRPSTFAYPYGRVDSRATGLVEGVFKYGCTTEFHVLGASVRAACLPRLDAFCFQDGRLLESWGTARFDRFVRRRHRLRRLRRLGADVSRVMRVGAGR
jgi:peptidoglycan/xylan/chitin deacetylase (PgdA/CDA1 family)